MNLYKQRNSRNGLLQPKWTVELKDHLSIKRRFAAFKDKNASRSFGNQLERLVAFRAAGRTLDIELINWLESLPDKMIKRLHTIGLIDNETSTATMPLMIAQKANKSVPQALNITLQVDTFTTTRSTCNQKNLPTAISNKLLPILPEP